MIESTLVSTALAAAWPAARLVAPPAASKAGVDAARSEGYQAGFAAGAIEERARSKAILGCDAAKARQDFAAHLAFDTDLAADAAIGILGKSPAAATRIRPDGKVQNPAGAADDPADGLMAALDRVSGKRA